MSNFKEGDRVKICLPTRPIKHGTVQYITKILGGDGKPCVCVKVDNSKSQRPARFAQVFLTKMEDTTS